MIEFGCYTQCRLPPLVIVPQPWAYLEPIASQQTPQQTPTPAKDKPK